MCPPNRYARSSCILLCALVLAASTEPQEPGTYLWSPGQYASCSRACILCASRDTCNQCVDGWVLLNGTCVLPAGREVGENCFLCATGRCDISPSRPVCASLDLDIGSHTIALSSDNILFDNSHKDAINACKFALSAGTWMCPPDEATSGTTVVSDLVVMINYLVAHVRADHTNDFLKAVSENEVRAALHLQNNGPRSVGVFRDACTARFGVIRGSQGGRTWPYPSCNPVDVPDYRYPTHVNGTVIDISQLSGDTFYHFVVEGLSRLASIYEYFQTHLDVRLHVTSKEPAFVPKWLKLLGVDPGRVVDGVVCAPTLIVPAPLPCFRVNARSVRELSRLLISRMLPVPRAPLLVVWYTRRGLGRREVVNAGVVRAALEDVVLGRGSVVDSADATEETYRVASAIVGPHGAGFTNMLFLRTPSLLIEFQESHIALCFARMAVALGIDHIMLFPKGATHTGQMVVDAHQVAAALKGWVDAHPSF